MPARRGLLLPCWRAAALLFLLFGFGGESSTFARAQDELQESAEIMELPPQTKFSANTDCPCLSQQEVAAKVKGSPMGVTNNAVIGGTCPGTMLPSTVQKRRGPTLECMPPELGSEVCRAWDSVLLEVCESHKNVRWWAEDYAARAASTNPATFLPADRDKLCGHGWCYVDPDRCITPPNRPSTLFPGSGLHYSYETCGYVETFGPRRLLEKLTDINGGSPIRVSYPGNDAYRLYRKPDGEVSGSFVEVFTGVQELINTVNKEPVPFEDGVQINDSAKQFVLDEFNVDSSYTACAAMIALNQTDVCVGPFWSLPERHAMAQYIYSFAADEFYMITYLVRPGSDLLLGPFLPFTGDVWLMLLASVLMVILAFSWLEITPRMIATYKVLKERGISPMPEPKTAVQKFQYSFRRFLEVFMMSLEGVLDFHPEGYNPLSNAGKILKMGYIMFMILFMATYTANLASILVSSQSKVEFSSLDEAIDTGVKICIPAVLVKKMSLLFPKLQPLAIPTGFEDVMDSMDAGLCRAGLSYDALNAVKDSKHCNKVEVSTPVVILPVSNLAQPHLAQAINAAIEAQVGPGLTEQVRTKFISEYIFDSKIEPCVGEDVTSKDKLNIVAMAGLFALLGMIITLAVVLDVWERLFPKTSGYCGGIEFKLARRQGGTCYLRDDWKNTYVLRLPPGLHYPKEVEFDDPNPDDSESDSGDDGPLPEMTVAQRRSTQRHSSTQRCSSAFSRLSTDYSRLSTDAAAPTSAPTTASTADDPTRDHYAMEVNTCPETKVGEAGDVHDHPPPNGDGSFHLADQDIGQDSVIPAAGICLPARQGHRSDDDDANAPRRESMKGIGNGLVSSLSAMFNSSGDRREIDVRLPTPGEDGDELLQSNAATSGSEAGLLMTSQGLRRRSTLGA